MREKKNFFSRLSMRLGVPPEGLPGGFSAFLSGSSEVTVRGCRKILRYEPECITLSVGKQEISVQGKSLFCTAYSAETVTVSGDIAALILSPAGTDRSAGKTLREAEEQKETGANGKGAKA